MYMKFLLPSLMLGAAAALFSPLSAVADEDLPKLRNSFFHVGLEAFKFTEHESSVDVVEETGLRLVAGASWSNLFVPSGGSIYRANITGYVGIADYECANRPITCPHATGATSESTYAGVRLEGMGGYRFGSVIGAELFSGVSFEGWYRTIADGEVNGGGTYTGYDTYNAVGSFKLGASLLQRFNKFGYFLRVGVKAPFAAWTRINIEDGLEFRSGGQLSPFANLDLTFGTLPRDRFLISFYYDGMNVVNSNPKELSSGGVPTGTTLATPGTSMGTFGVQLIFGF